MTPFQIIEALGGRLVVSHITGARPNAVSNWYRAGIPARYWYDIALAAEAAHVEGVTLHTLRQADARRRANPPTTAAA